MHHVYAEALRLQRTLDPLELKLQVFVTHLM